MSDMGPMLNPIDPYERRQPDRPAPILVDCDGSWYPANGIYTITGMDELYTVCPVCGQGVPVHVDPYYSSSTLSRPSFTPPTILPHQRQDILTMIARGDFN